MGATEQSRRIVILTGTDSVATCRSIEALCRESTISIVGILFDRNPQTIKKAWKNLRRNIGREGYGYIGYRFFVAIRDGLESLANIATPQSAASEILQSAFPQESWSIRNLVTRTNIPFFEVDNLNSAEAAETVRGLNADLAVVVGTRILKPSVFNVPRLGAINLHKGKVPEFRGIPPGFWELYEGVKTAG